VYKPTTKELYYAQKGGGAFMEINGGEKRITVSETKSIIEAKFVVSRMSQEHSEYMQQMGIINTTTVGSAALKICKVAQGEYDAYFVLKSKMSEWDDCAAGIILSEAGGTLSDVFGYPMAYNQENVLRTKGTVATNKNLHKELLKKIYPIAMKKYPDHHPRPQINS